MKAPMFSVVVVSLNAGEKLIQTIENIAAQTYPGYEVIVKDGGSGDASLEALGEVLKRYPEELRSRFRIFTERDKSIYEGMNQAVGKAKGEYLYFLNCGDSFFSRDVLEKVAGYIDREEKNQASPLIYYGDIWEELRGTKVASNPKMDGFACYRHVPCHQACMYHRSLFEERAYDLSYRVRADYEHFLWSYYVKEARPAYIPVILASYEGGGFSETAESRERSKAEHRAVTTLYMSKRERFMYRVLLWLTLAPLRTKMAESSFWSGYYQKVKLLVYGKKRKNRAGKA